VADFVHAVNHFVESNMAGTLKYTDPRDEDADFIDFSPVGREWHTRCNS
jgi:hypothetical protein